MERPMKRSKDAENDEDWQPVEARKPPRASAVYSIRFTGSRLAGLRSIARLERIRISDIVHRAIDLYLATDVALTIRAGSPDHISSNIYSRSSASVTTALRGNYTLDTV